MPNLEHELEQLELAERHIERAQSYIARLRFTNELHRARGLDVSISEVSLKVAEEALEVFVRHRRLIRQIIEDIRSGSLPES